MITGLPITVTATPTLLAQPQRWHTVDDPLPVIITNRDAAVSVYIGGPTVVAVTGGYELKAGEEIGAQLSLGDDLYAITSAGSVRVDVLKARQGG